MKKEIMRGITLDEGATFGYAKQAAQEAGRPSWHRLKPAEYKTVELPWYKKVINFFMYH